jgi:hypothetical protein
MRSDTPRYVAQYQPHGLSMMHPTGGTASAEAETDAVNMATKSTTYKRKGGERP